MSLASSVDLSCLWLIYFELPLGSINLGVVNGK